MNLRSVKSTLTQTGHQPCWIRRRKLEEKAFCTIISSSMVILPQNGRHGKSVEPVSVQKQIFEESGTGNAQHCLCLTRLYLGESNLRRRWPSL